MRVHVCAYVPACIVHMCELHNCKQFSVAPWVHLCVVEVHYVFLMVMIHCMEQLSEAFTGAGFLMIKSVCSDYDYLTVTMLTT